MNYSERTCEYCNKSFSVPSFVLKNKAARFCSTICFRKNLHKSYEQKTCPICKKEYMWPNTDKDKKYCSKKCLAIALTKQEQYTCDICGKETSVRPHRAKVAKYCSRECINERIVTDETKTKMRQNSHPEKSRIYKGGISKTRAYKNFYSLMHIHRKRAADGNMSRDEWESIKNKQQNKCAICGKCEPLIKLSIDHIIPTSKGGSNNPSNVQALCISCNSRKYNKIYAVG